MALQMAIHRVKKKKLAVILGGKNKDLTNPCCCLNNDIS